MKTQAWVWGVLAAALVAVSSAGVALRLIEGVQPCTKASWRLQATSCILLPGFLWQFLPLMSQKGRIARAYILSKLSASSSASSALYHHLELTLEESELKKKYLAKRTILVLLASGVSLGLHFGTWVWSLDYTSLAHSLLFVTAHPIVIVALMVIFRKPVSRFEIIGCLVGFLGLIVTLLDSLDSGSGNSNDNVSVVGDIVAFIGALCIVVYLAAGRELRSFTPLYMYAFPVTLISAVVLGLAAAAFERQPVPSKGYGVFSIVGWSGAAFIGKVAYLAFGPGFVGHTGLNAILKYIEPVVISVTLLMEPVIGSIIGYFAQVSGSPGFYTFLGGILIMGGCGMVSHGERKRNEVKAAPVVAVVNAEHEMDDLSSEKNISPAEQNEDVELREGDSENLIAR